MAAKYPSHTHILEGDLCWNFGEGRQDLYFRHPSLVIDTLSASQIDREVSDRKLVRLEDCSELVEDDVFLIIELKIGVGDKTKALKKAVDFLQQNFRDRFWIDGFSLPLLATIKKIDPSICVTLHTEFVVNGFVLVGAPEWPPLRVRRIANLNGIDGIAIRWRLGRSFMQQACESVILAGKVLIMSRLENLERFRCSRDWKSRAGYVKWNFDELVRLQDGLVKGEPSPAHLP